MHRPQPFARAKAPEAHGHSLPSAPQDDGQGQPEKQGMTTTEPEEWWDICRKRYAKREDIPNDLAPIMEIMKQASKAVFFRKLASGAYTIVRDWEVNHVHIVEIVEADRPNTSNMPGAVYIEVLSSATLRRTI